MKSTLSILFLFFCVISYSQTTVSGTVFDENNQPIPGANVIVVGTTTGTVTDFDGGFTLTVNQDPPFTLQASIIGFSTESMEITENNQTVQFILEEGTQLDEIVISASRTPERIFESPVTVERFGLKEIKNTASADFYSGIGNLKGVDINTNSLTFQSVNTRGFATFANERFMQLIDGMDNSTPALNFPIGNLVGINEVDVQSVELLPGASSSLYGANAFNGILFMTSKNPFDHSGISGYYKRGITSQDAAGDNTYQDLGIRVAHKFSDKFAAKVNFGWLKGTDWWATNYQGKPGTGDTRASLGYDGYNVYGDEVVQNIRTLSGGLGVVPDVMVSRTGYNESDLTDYNAESIKADWGLYYRPWANDFEIQYVGKIGTGSTIYQGTNRYYIDNFTQQQHKLELKNNNFFLRGYVVSDTAGDSYDMVLTGINIANAWKSHADWYGDYISTYVGATLGGATDQQAHAAARAAAESGRLEPGTPAFQRTFNEVISDADWRSGSKFQDASKYYHANGNYNFSHLWDVVEIQVGGSYRKYKLNSSGTIYTDADGPIDYSEYGVYTQLQKKFDLSNDISLKLTGSIRYDKSEFFDGFLSPRLSAGVTIKDNHNIRASYQTGFRNPTTQDLFIGLDTGFGTILVGAAPDNLDRYERTYQGNDGNSYTQSGRAAYENSYSYSSYQAYLNSNDIPELRNSDLLEIGNSELVKPEQVQSFEIGYRGKFESTIIDLSVYYNNYKDFISNELVWAPLYGDVSNTDVDAANNGDGLRYQTYTNSPADVSSFGGSIGVSTKFAGNFDLSANYTYAKQDFDDNKYPDFRTSFNTPEHKVKVIFGNTEFIKNLGFNVAWKWSDTYEWQATFADGQIPSYHTIDAQFNLTIPKLKSSLKAGAVNALGEEYFTAIGTGYIGSMYYLSWTINNL